MACEFTLSASPLNITVDYWGTTDNRIVTVTVDGSTTNNSYYIENEGDYVWFTIERDRNTLTLRFDPYFEFDSGDDTSNPDYHPRTAFIRLTHNCDASKSVDVNITQRGVPYNIVWNNEGISEITLKPLAEVTAIASISVTGGSEDFFIKSVKRFSGDTYGTEGKHYELDYDYGLELIADNPNSQLVIHSYGRTFVDEGDFYEITLAHKDYRYKTCTIPVYYDDNPVYSFEKSIELSVDEKPLSEIYFDYRGIVDPTSYDYVNIVIFPSRTTEDGGYDFDEGFTDYGYDYEVIECVGEGDDEECGEPDWLTVSDNPTSLSFVCEPNCGSEPRSAMVTVWEYTNGERGASQTLTITQDFNQNYQVSTTNSIITVPYDTNGETYTASVRVYGGTRELASLSHSNVAGIICSLDADYEDDCAYSLYTITFTINSDNTTGEDKVLSLEVKHKDDENVFATITFTQLCEESESAAMQNTSVGEENVDGTLFIDVIACPSNSQLTLLSTGYWCHLSSEVISEPEDGDPCVNMRITVTCDNNYWGDGTDPNDTRKCRLVIGNASNSNGEVIYEVTQKKDDADGNVVFSVEYITAS
ncbi:MAG: hypothetical protein LUD72_09555 [Bacteroidales bacterium]|nr:hypothetical protein [Bacteroidales bacterium]